jgi:hypothetical protein
MNPLCVLARNENFVTFVWLFDEPNLLFHQSYHYGAAGIIIMCGSVLKF